jgi:uncharacterized membrane protein YfcA
MMRVEDRVEWLVWPGLVLLGVGVGAYGTLIGAGGGFLLVPALIVLYPEWEPEVLTSVSLAVVLMTAVSASSAYTRQRRVDYKAGVLFACATVPGAIISALAVQRIHSSAFEVAFAVLLLVVAVWLLLPRPNRVLVSPPPRHYIRRLLTDRHGDTYSYSFDPYLGLALGLVVGLVATLFGVGGGIFYVPAMVLIMRFPAYVAVATSSFVLMFTAGSASAVHAIAGSYSGVEGETLALIVGTVGGGQLGAFASARLVARQGLVLRLLSSALIIVSLRQLLAVLLQ